jgi:hypothetical protein
MTDVIDVNSLETNVPDMIDWDAYEDAVARKPMPPEARYTFQIGNEVVVTVGADKNVSATFDMTILDGEHAGYQMRFVRVSSRRFRNANACSAGDLLRNVESPYRPQSPDEWEMALKAAAGTIAQDVECVWEAYDKETKQSTKYMKNFPKRDGGTFQPWLEKADGVDENGEPKTKRIWANLKTTARGFSKPQARQ